MSNPLRRTSETAQPLLSAAPATISQSFIARSAIYRDLGNLKHMYGKDPVVDEAFAKRKESYQRDSNASEDVRHRQDVQHLKHFCKAFGEMNDANERCFSNVQSFLDIGCAPGGFSSWILENDVHSKGVGVTLPSNEGLNWALDDKYRAESRYGLHEADVINSVLDSSACGPPLTPDKKYDLVMLALCVPWAAVAKVYLPPYLWPSY